MASRVEIELKTIVDKAIADLKKVGQAVTGVDTAAKKSKGGLKEFASGADNVVRGMTGLSLTTLGAGGTILEFGKFIKDSVTEVGNYAKEIRTLSTDIGATAEETQMLIQAADDVGISVGTLQTGLEAAIRKGVKPSIEGMGELADQYNSIQDPIERTKFLMDNFGRSGADLARLMELGGKGMKAAGEEAKKLGLVLDQEALAAAERARVAYDDLGDTWEGIKLKAGTAAIPTVTNLTKVVKFLLSPTEDVNDAWRQLMADIGLAPPVINSAVGGFGDLRAAEQQTTDATEEVTTADYNARNALEMRSQAMDDAIAAGKELTGMQGDLAKATDDLASAEQNWMDKAGGDLVGLLDDAGLKAGAYGDALTVIDGVYGTDLATQKAYKDDLKEAVDQYKKTGDLEAFKTKLGEIKDTYLPLNDAVLEATNKVNDLNTAINNLQDKDVYIYEHTIKTTDPEPMAGVGSGPRERSGQGSGNIGVDQEFAEGGSMVVPPGHPNDDYIIGVSSGEQVNVTPPGQAGAGGVNIYGDITVVANNPTDFINQLRNARKSGAAYIHR